MTLLHFARPWSTFVVGLFAAIGVIGILPAQGSPLTADDARADIGCLPPAYYGVRAGLLNAERFPSRSTQRRAQIARVTPLMLSLDAEAADAVWHKCDIDDRVGVLQIWFAYLSTPKTYPPNVHCAAWEAASDRDFIATRLLQLSVLGLSRNDRDFTHVYAIIRAGALTLSMNPPGQWGSQAQFTAYAERYERQVAEAQATAVGCPTQ